MSRYLVVTTCNAEQWAQYGANMVDTFTDFWDKHVRLRIYAEGWGGNDLDAAAPWLAKFKKLYKAPQFNGGENRRDYRRDAVRFAHKVAAIGAAAETADCDVLIWCDADVVTHEPVTVEWLDSLFPKSADLAWLDRDRAYPECGFLMFRMPAAKKLISTVIDAYREGAIFKLPETHDSYVWQNYVGRLGIKTHSLSGPEGRKHIGHPWCSSPLASKMDHLKGETRKAHGRSLSSDLRVPRPEPYWQ
jgi:hypothetical protein